MYIYVTAPVKEIRCKCLVTAANLPFDISEDDGYTLICSRAHKRYMDLKLVEIYNNPFLGYQLLLMNGLSGPIRSQRRVSPELLNYIETTSQNFVSL